MCASLLCHVFGSLITLRHELKTQERRIKGEAAECKDAKTVTNLEESSTPVRWESAMLGGFAPLSSAGIKAGRNMLWRYKDVGKS